MEDSVETIVTKTEMIYEQLIEYAMAYGLRIIAAIVILYVGFWIANRTAQLASSALDKKDFDATIRVYLARILGIVFKVLVVITAAGVMGVETTSFVAVLGAAGLAVGLALQGSLANFAGGVLILVLRPFKVGDFINSQGADGIVTAIDVFYTTMVTLDNKRVFLPNGPLIGNVIVNFSGEPTRRVDLAVGISYGESIDRVEKVLLNIASQHKLVHKTPEPFVGVSKFGESSVDLVFRVWCDNAVYWDVYHDVLKKVKSEFDAAKITIPFPQRETRIIKD
jgi:small conductance mechanosensitive channel